MWCAKPHRPRWQGVRSSGSVLLLGALLVSAQGRGWDADFGFAPPFSFSLAGSAPSDMAVNDFNGDGHLDIAVAMAGGEGGTGAVSIMLGNGRGLFRDESFAVDFAPRGIASADFNGDGRIDLALAAGVGGSSAVHVLLGDGNGHFGQPGTRLHPFSSSHALDVPAAVAVADFDGDGRPDLAVANSGNPHGLTLHYGRGDGTFADGVALEEAITLSARDIEAADLDGDGRPDLVVPQAVFLNRGNGGGALSAALGGTTAVALDDLDGDGHIDVVTLDAGELKAWRGMGAGKFRLATISAVTGRPHCLKIGDLNHDGVPDVALSDSARGQVTVLPGRGQGLFARPQSFAVGVEPLPLVIGDWNEDQLPDIAVAEGSHGDQPYLSILLQYAGRPLQPARLASVTAAVK